MGLEQIEAALARLYTDAALRERFFAEPLAVGRSLGLDAGEAGQLAAVDRERVELFAQSLVTKRYGEVRSLLPRLHGALGEDPMRALFLRFARGFVPAGLNKHNADAIAFARFALGELGGAAREAAGYEAAAAGLFFRLDGREARQRRGPSLALARLGGRWRLLVRSRRSSRFRALRLPL